MPDRTRLPTVDRHILPIFVASTAPSIQLVSHQGTAFLISPNLIVTCWHCVRSELSENQRYVAVLLSEDGATYEPRVLENVSQDASGTDLATANIDLTPDLEFEIARQEPRHGANVWTFGYPFTDVEREDDCLMFRLNGRRFQGYVTRPWIYPSRDYGEIDSYELDMPVPGGLSGAPLMVDPSLLVGGVIYRSHDVEQVDEFASVDPETNERKPEIRRIVSFGLAHSLRSLKRLAGAATGGRPLEEVAKA
jgi:hypothetical protein